MQEDQKVPDRSHALNVIAADLSELYGWLLFSTRFAAAHEALAVVERRLGLPVGNDPVPSSTNGRPSPSEDSAAVLAEVLAAINTYDPLMFSDQHRALFERAAPPPPSVPAGADVAEVLGELAEEMREVEASYRVLSRDGHEGMDGLAEAWAAAADMVGAQAATGARAAGGELPAVSSEEVGRTAESSEPPSVGPPQSADRLTTHASVGKAQLTGLGDAPRTVNEVDGELGGAVGVGEIPHDPSLAPPTPVAPGVAELLAEARRLIKEWPGTVMPCAEIVRLLSPAGPDGAEAGT